MRQLLAHRNARLYLSGQVMSLLGDGALWLAMGIWIKVLTGSSSAAGLSFFALALKMRPAAQRAAVSDRDFTVIVPAFITSELRRAFQIGFLLFIPFLVVDMVVANLLLALGMHMLSPTTVSLPFKLLLFVLADGWQLVIRGLLESYL